ncbi:MAG: sigma-70 family RNA polymerase sigma factor [Clostridia bacterium]|nr:sigma-70 family RNA polymerase sigma factor [Clostridia bacterium]
MNMKESALADLLKAIKEGSDVAFETLIAQYEPLLCASVSRVQCKLAPLVADEQDIMQEARCALYRAAMSFSFEQAHVTFGLYAEICIRNALTSKFLRKKPSSECSLDEIVDKGIEPASPLGDALDTLIENEAAELLYAIIRRTLSPLELSVFELHEQGLSTLEIATRLSRSQKSVENALARAVKKLRKMLAPD